MTTYITRSRRAEAIQYDGTNAEQIIAFAGKVNAAQRWQFAFGQWHMLGCLEVRGTGGTWKNLAPGDWVIKDLADGWMHPATQETFARVWEEE